MSRELAERLAKAWRDSIGCAACGNMGWYQVTDRGTGEAAQEQCRCTQMVEIFETELAAAESGSILETVRQERDQAWMEVSMLEDRVATLTAQIGKMNQGEHEWADEVSFLSKENHKLRAKLDAQQGPAKPEEGEVRRYEARFLPTLGYQLTDEDRRFQGAQTLVLVNASDHDRIVAQLKQQNLSLQASLALHEGPHVTMSQEYADELEHCINSLEQQNAELQQSRDYFCHSINKIAHLFWGENKDAYSPEAILRKVAELQSNTERLVEALRGVSPYHDEKCWCLDRPSEERVHEPECQMATEALKPFEKGEADA